MITLDQVLLLQEKVESAVAKIAQLKAENDALRSKCAELTNALSAKTEQFSTFEADQSKIEHGILQALERLNAVENAVLGDTLSAAAPVQAQPAPVEATVVQAPSVTSAPAVEQAPTAPQAEEAEVTQEAPLYQEAAAQQAPVESYPQQPAESFEEPEAPQQPAFEEPAYTEPQQYTAPEVAPAQESEPADDKQQGQFDIF